MSSTSAPTVDASTQAAIAEMAQAAADSAAVSAASAKYNEKINEDNTMAKTFGNVGQ